MFSCHGENDHMSAFVMIGSRLSQLGTFCGNEIPPRLMSSENFLTMEFVFKSETELRNPLVQYRYKFTYKFVSDFGIPNLVRDTRHS
jgi:hypothetical protein